MKVRVAFVIGQYPPEERKRREEVALSYATPEIEIGIISTSASPYIHGMSPADIQMAAPYFIEAFREAERQGYDAAVPLGMLDLGIDGGKSAVDIPVVGPFEATFHVASLLGDRFGLIVYHPEPSRLRGRWRGAIRWRLRSPAFAASVFLCPILRRTAIRWCRTSSPTPARSSTKKAPRLLFPWASPNARST